MLHGISQRIIHWCKCHDYNESSYDVRVMCKVVFLEKIVIVNELNRNNKSLI